MLWTYSLQYSGMIDAPSSIAAARHLLIEKLKADPASFISKLTPADPSAQGFLDLSKRVVGLK